MNTVTFAQHTPNIAADRRVVLGFWLYLMTDLVVFAALFAVFFVLASGHLAIPPALLREGAPALLIETSALLVSSLCAALALLAAQQGKHASLRLLLSLVALLGMFFLFLEVREFHTLIQAGFSWQTHGSISAFFTLVGTHGIHIALGLLWLGVIGLQLRHTQPTTNVLRSLALWSLFWHFLDIVWIAIFSFVYLPLL